MSTKHKTSSPVIIRITGGLGNQMFQYAFGKAYSQKHERPLQLDVLSYRISMLKGFRVHNGYELHKVFGISKSAGVLTWLRSGAFQYMVRLLLHKVFGTNHTVPKTITVENPHDYFSYQEDYLSRASTRYVQGFFQNPGYVERIREVLLGEFVFSECTSEANRVLQTQIEQSESVSIHVRRGDYVDIPQLNVCDGAYYQRAITYMRDAVSQPKFFVFSNDMKWCRDNLGLSDEEVVYVDHNHGDKSYRDMQLISLCKHNIIANSSFSWWGAWLNTHHESIVVAPAMWHGDYPACNPAMTHWHTV